jgi:hypothetical protein
VFFVTLEQPYFLAQIIRTIDAESELDIRGHKMQPQAACLYYGKVQPEAALFPLRAGVHAYESSVRAVHHPIQRFNHARASLAVFLPEAQQPSSHRIV